MYKKIIQVVLFSLSLLFISSNAQAEASYKEVELEKCLLKIPNYEEEINPYIEELDRILSLRSSKEYKSSPEQEHFFIFFVSRANEPDNVSEVVKCWKERDKE